MYMDIKYIALHCDRCTSVWMALWKMQRLGKAFLMPLYLLMESTTMLHVLSLVTFGVCLFLESTRYEPLLQGESAIITRNYKVTSSEWKNISFSVYGIFGIIQEFLGMCGQYLLLNLSCLRFSRYVEEVQADVIVPSGKGVTIELRLKRSSR